MVYPPSLSPPVMGFLNSLTHSVEFSIAADSLNEGNIEREVLNLT